MANEENIESEFGVPTDHLRPCPFCGNPKPTDRFAHYPERVFVDHTTDVFGNTYPSVKTVPEKEEHAIGCGVCNVQMPTLATRKEAVFLWNMRPRDWARMCGTEQ